MNSLKWYLEYIQRYDPLTKEEGRVLKSNTVETSPQKKEEHANS